jgi:hypothetical protein
LKEGITIIKRYSSMGGEGCQSFFRFVSSLSGKRKKRAGRYAFVFWLVVFLPLIFYD